MDILPYRSVVGMLLILGIAYALSYNRKAISWRIVFGGLALQIVFALIVLKTDAGKLFFFAVNDVIVALLGFAKSGATFIFGNLVDNTIPVTVTSGEPADPRTLSGVANAGAFFAFSVLPTIIFFASFMAVCYYLGIMQRIVKMVSWVMQKTLRTSGAETLSASANIFVGQTEAPLIIRPYLAKMTRSELFCVMTGGFATVAGGVMAAYAGFLLTKFPTIAGHLMAASVMAAPAGLVMAKIICPEEGKPETADGAGAMDIPVLDSNVIDAASRGASEGMALAINVAAMLIAFIALIALGDKLVGLAALLVGKVLPLGFIQTLSTDASPLRLIFGWIVSPLAWIMGAPWQDCRAVGQLMATKTVVNEFVAYLDMAGMIDRLSPRALIICTYALCGFANFSSIGIQIGGISALCPERRHDLAKIGLKAMIAGTLASFMTATIAGTIMMESRSSLIEHRAQVSSEITAPAAPSAAAKKTVSL